LTGASPKLGADRLRHRLDGGRHAVGLARSNLVDQRIAFDQVGRQLVRTIRARGLLDHVDLHRSEAARA
jgi:hypothetical protein